MLILNSKTYLIKYKNIISLLTYKVNTYFVNHTNLLDKKYPINDKLFLQYLSSDEKFYKKIIINQKNKQRCLYEPVTEIKYIQKFILHSILYKNIKKYNFAKNVTGFLKDTNILNNAYPHLNKFAIIKMDIKDFFPTISRSMIFNKFRQYNKFSYEYSYILSKLVTYKDFLPQGAPTSPFIANICAKGIDFRINKLIETINKNNNISIEYTRFADDITLSFNKKFNYDYIISIIYEIIIDEGFFPNYSKTRVIKKSQCQKVTGIVVNHDKCKIESKEIKKIYFILIIWNKYGILDAIKLWNKHKMGTTIIDNPNKKQQFNDIINGKISYFDMINSNQSQKLRKLLQDNICKN